MLQIASLGNGNRWPRSLFFTNGNKKKTAVQRISHQFNVLNAQIVSCLSRCVRARIVMMKYNLAFPVCFLLANYGCVSQNLLFCDAVDTVAICRFSEETGHHLLWSAWCVNNFCWIWLTWYTRTVDCCLHLASYKYIHDSSPITIP